MTTFSGIASSSEEFKETRMSMYLQDFIAGPNVTDIPLRVSPESFGASVNLEQFMFTNKEYNGSTLEIQGNSILREPVRELSVVSGTGKFWFARGYAMCETAETYSVDSLIGYAVVRFNVTVEHK
ncbi:hypothetical protein ACLB2K_067466 [Fragaria x ananassa]